MSLLEGVEIGVRGKEERKEEEVKDIRDMIEDEEIRTALRRMKLKKAAGIDGISMEDIRKRRIMDKIGGPVKNNMEERNDSKGMEKKHYNTFVFCFHWIGCNLILFD